MSDITPVGEPTVFFVYGTLQPGELGYPVIAEEVSESVDAWVNGWCLWIRDGLPFIVPADPKDEHPMTVKGSLLVPKRGREGSLAESIRRFENRELYSATSLTLRQRVEQSRRGSIGSGRAAERTATSSTRANGPRVTTLCSAVPWPLSTRMSRHS